MHSVKITWMAWYICVVFALVFFGTTFLVHYPVLSVGSLVTALLCAVIATIFSRLPLSHWVHKSRVLFFLSVFSSLIATLVFLSVFVG